MIDFYSEGSQVGFSINSIGGVVLFCYIFIELLFKIHTKTFLFHKFFLGIRVRYEVKKIIPKWWYIESVSYFSIKRNTWLGQHTYKVYVRVRSKIPTGGRQIYGDNTCYANDLIELNWLGVIKKENLTSWIESEDHIHKNEIKQWSRNKALEEIGV